MRRRDFLAAGVLMAAPQVMLPSSPFAQSPKLPVVGILWHAGNAEEEKPYRTPLLEGLANQGYVAGKNILFEERYADETPSRFSELAAELARLNPDVIVAVSNPSAFAAQRATSTIPVVFVPVPDPVRAKLVASLSRPGGNLTGIASLAENIWSKRLQVLKQALPNVSNVAVLASGLKAPEVFRAAAPVIEEIRAAADTFGLRVTTFEADSVDELRPAFKQIGEGRFEAVLLGPSVLFYAEKKRIADLALEYRVPTIGAADLFVEDGVLMSYGPSWPPMFRRVAWYVDRILKGGNPAEMPVEQPTTFETVVNLRTAKALGLELPLSFLNLADRIIE